MKYSVDRIEENIAVCEDENGEKATFEASLLPDGVKEGDIIMQTDGVFNFLPDETAERRKKMAELQKSIFTRKKG